MEDNDSTSPTNFVQYWMSNASMNMYPKNKPQEFKIHLAKPLQLKGEWEIGLNSIFYPFSWHNIKSSAFEISFQRSDVVKSIISSGFDAGQFQDIPSLLTKLNARINADIQKYRQMLIDNESPTSNLFPTPTKEKYIEFVEDDKELTVPKKIVMKTYTGAHSIIMTPNQYSVFGTLGFDTSQTRIYIDRVAPFCPSLQMHQPALFVYSPIINEVDVGDVKAKLLSLVPIQGKMNEVAYVRFEKPIYNRITHNYLSDIEVSIRDDQGDPVEFLLGKVMMVVHFRRIG